MQSLSTFSRARTVPQPAGPAPGKNLWILNSWRDLLLYVGTPVLLVPVFALAQTHWSAQDIYLFVGAFGAVGHHLPGMIRAYGDRALFNRFRWRFIFAPIFLLAVCVSFTVWDLQGIVLMAFFWGVWHGMMQTYGFCRIYDAKVGSFASMTRRLDFALCASWFASAVVNSPSRMNDMLKIYYASGGPFIPPGIFHGVQQGTFFIALTVAALFVANFALLCWERKRPNPVKLALLGSSIAFWWFCNNGVKNILAGIALFEVFHDVQYLSIVWIYNRNRVEKDRSISGFMRFLFRRSGALVGLYVGLVLAYGSFSYFNTLLDSSFKHFLTGVVAASGMLHFYYDGFIWKVRERSTRESLGLAGTAAAGAQENFVPAGVLHASKWIAAFVIPLGALWIAQVHGTAPDLQQQAWVVADVPNGARPHYVYAVLLRDSGHYAEAAEQFRLALQFKPNDEAGHYSLAHIFLHEGRFDEAAVHLKRALQIKPRIGDFHSDYGYVLEHRGQIKEAVAEYKTGLRLSPRSAVAHYDYAMYLWRAGDLKQSAVEFQSAIAIDHEHVDAHYDFGNLLYQQNRLKEAEAEYVEACRLAPKRSEIHNKLGVVYVRQGEVSQAILQFAEALQLDPNDALAAENLRRAQAMDLKVDRNLITP